MNKDALLNFLTSLESLQKEIVKAGGDPRFFTPSRLAQMSLLEIYDTCVRNKIELALVTQSDREDEK